MLKRFVLFFLLFKVFSLNAQGYEFSLGDDVLALNLINSVKNARTMSFYTITPLLYDVTLGMNYTLYTNDETGSRIDEATVLLSYPMETYIEIIPSIGVTISGNLSGSSVEDSLMKLVESSDSEEERVGTYFYSSCIFAKNTEIANFQKSGLFTRVYSKLEAITNYTLGIELGYYLTFAARNFSSNLGYRYGYGYNYMDSGTIDYVKNLEDEGKVNFSIIAGNFRYDIDFYLDGSFSTGKYSIKFGDLKEGRELREINVKVIPSIEYDIASENFLNNMRVSVIPFNWGLSRYEVTIESTYGKNKPMLKNTTLNTLFYEKTYFNRITLNIDGSLKEHFLPFWINPYMGIGIGTEIYRYTEEEEAINNFIPVYKLSAGSHFMFPQFLVKDNIQYGLDLNFTFRESLSSIRYKNNFLVNAGIVIAVEI